MPVPVGVQDMSVDGGSESFRPPCLRPTLGTPGAYGLGNGGGAPGVPAATLKKKRGSGAEEKLGIYKIPDRAWTIALDYLELGEASKFTTLW